MYIYYANSSLSQRIPKKIDRPILVHFALELHAFLVNILCIRITLNGRHKAKNETEEKKYHEESTFIKFTLLIIKKKGQISRLLFGFDKMM